ncbi:hypothetical protein [Micromonospora sp. C28ISP2-4]|uniref:hypothetical protein n=1 Tax=Micromonospora sp. C28ISP2-4 TaxID=3059523 RepID=UPI0026756F13|nr:hypothetical protein [Micromonospora sp. C28ISP2-4]MDO3684600.1 hypothetical protein [Micromonospora sp. C28ISP2-4]
MPESSFVTSGTGVVPDDSEAGSDAPATRSDDAARSDAARSGGASRSGGGANDRAGAAAAGPVAVDRETLRLALVVGGLVLAVLLGFGLGRMNAPAGPARPAGATAGVATGGADGGAHAHSPGTGAHTHDGATVTQGGGDGATGLSITSSGYTLAPSTELVAGRAGELRFQIRDDQRRAVTRFAVVHDKPMHVIMVRRDLGGYRHLHPTMAADGTWSVPITAPEAGPWRMYADFTAVADDGGQVAVVLGADLTASGAYRPRPLPAAATSATVDGFTVGYAGTPEVGKSVPLRFRVTGADGAAAALEPYLGAFGHLVALREGDLGYLHVHPEPVRDGDDVTFWLTAPGPGSYRMFLDFQVGGVVRTAEFTLTVA